MANLKIGCLFKKIKVDIKNKQYVVFETVDYVTAICFWNADGTYMCNVTSGANAGIYAGLLGNEGEFDYIFFEDDLSKIIEKNDNRVNFETIRKKNLENSSKYYYKESNTCLSCVKNKKILKYLENYNKKDDLDFDDKEFENTSDISSMYSEIKKTIISQDEQIMQILTSLFKNQKVADSNLDLDLIAKIKENILIYGSTGTGKTEILKRISKIYNIPIVIEDATSLSETGYQGRKITDMLEDLYLASNNDIELAEKGILVIDEFDKLAEKGNQSHVSKLGVQRSLLKLLDGSLFYLDGKKFDTSKLTIVGVGAFIGITSDDNYSQLTTNDFIEYGIIRELIGRFSKTIAMNPLSKEDIIKILKESDFSPLTTYKKLFDMLDVEFVFNDEFIEYIAEIAVKKQSGARSLKNVFDDCISSALFRIFAGEYSSISLVKPNDDNNKPYVLSKK